MVTINFNCQTQTYQHTLTHIHTARTHMGTKCLQIESLIRFLTHNSLHSLSFALYNSLFLMLSTLSPASSVVWANLGLAHMPMHNLC